MESWEKAENDPAGLNVKRVGGSGSGVLKGDQVGPEEMVEVKTTGNKSFSVSSELLRKLKRQAAQQGKMPIMRVVLQIGTNTEETFAVLPWDVFLLMYEAINED